MKMTMEDSKTAVQTHQGSTQKIEYNKRVWQKDWLPAEIFTIALNGRIRACKLELICQ